MLVLRPPSVTTFAPGLFIALFYFSLGLIHAVLPSAYSDVFEGARYVAVYIALAAYLTWVFIHLHKKFSKAAFYLVVFVGAFAVVFTFGSFIGVTLYTYVVLNEPVEPWALVPAFMIFLPIPISLVVSWVSTLRILRSFPACKYRISSSLVPAMPSAMAVRMRGIIFTQLDSTNPPLIPPTLLPRGPQPCPSAYSAADLTLVCTRLLLLPRLCDDAFLLHHAAKLLILAAR